MTPLQKAAHAAIANSDEFYALYKRTVTSGCIPVCELKFVAAQKELRKALDAELAQSVEPVAWIKLNDDGRTGALFHQNEGWKDASELIPLYLHPPQPQTTAPEGYVLVPIEPTIEMLKAGQKAELFAPTQRSAYRVYNAMLEAAQGEKP